MQNKNVNSYIKTDDNKIINEKFIRWIKQMDECLMVCAKPDGCYMSNTHKICKSKNPDSYAKLNKHFESIDQEYP